MNSLQIAFLVVLLIPLVAATWRMSLFGLALQGFLLGWMSLRQDEGLSPSMLLLLIDFVLVRGVLAPRYLYGIMKSRNAPPRNDVIPANLLFWTLAGTIVLLAFRCAGTLSHGDAAAVTNLAVAGAALFLGMLVLSTQNSPFSQIVGVLRLENGIALFEIGSPHRFSIPVQIGVALIFFVSVLLLGNFLDRLLDPVVRVDSPERPTL